MTHTLRTLAVAAIAMAFAATAQAQVKIERLNPEGLSKPAGYSQVVTAAGGKRVWLSGQGGIRDDGTVPEDLAEQTKIMFEKIALALKGAGATPADVVAMRVYIGGLGQGTDPNPVYAGIRNFFPAGAKPTSTVLGVTGFAVPGMKVEVEVEAVVKE
ncbi:MAG: RidA family protein [Rhodospirillaceae bacterium]|nr:RidA family protein [Rhodospirillaceae bacterium]